MALKSKLDLLNLSEEERIKVQTRFMATLPLVDEKELREELEFLESKGVKITKAREVKVLAEPVANLVKKFSILGEIHEEDLYVQDPSQIVKNAIDIYKKIQYCKQVGKVYKNEEGKYSNFLFSEKSWNNEINKENEFNQDISLETEEDIVTLEPVVDNVINFQDYISKEHDIAEDVVESDFEKTIQFENISAEPIIDDSIDKQLEDTKHIDINVYKSATEDMKKIEEKTTDFSTVRKELESQLAELDNLKNFSMGEISFSDLEPESYGMGRAA